MIKFLSSTNSNVHGDEAMEMAATRLRITSEGRFVLKKHFNNVQLSIGYGVRLPRVRSIFSYPNYVWPFPFPAETASPRSYSFPLALSSFYLRETHSSPQAWAVISWIFLHLETILFAFGMFISFIVHFLSDFVFSFTSRFSLMASLNLEMSSTNRVGESIFYVFESRKIWIFMLRH